MTRLFLLVFLIAAVAGAFYAGRRYRGPIPYLDEGQAVAELTPTPAPVEDPLIKFERGRRTVDANPVAWLNQLASSGVLNPLESADPEFLYLYGRASLLAGNTEEARQAFEAAITKASLAPSPANATVGKEAALGLAGVSLRSDKDRPAAITRFEEVMRSQPSPGSSVYPNSSPLGSP